MALTLSIVISPEDALSQLERGADTIIPRDELLEKLRKSEKSGEPLRIKLGLDPTAPDIHLGFAVVLRKLRQFQDLGHHAHLIIGDFTAQIGDPSGKSKTRPQLTREQVEENAKTYEQQLSEILDPAKTTIHFNGDWLGKMGFDDVIRLTAKYTVAQMLEREDFAQRLADNKPVGMHEILYPLCQGQDSVEIKADVELGGTDQRFNNLVGRDLQKASGQEAQVVLLMPILVGLDGTQKMSKSLGNYVGIGEAPAEMFGKLMSIPDDVMRQYYTLCTAVALDEVEQILAGHPMDAKKRLGREIVEIYHGADAAQSAQLNFEQKFSPKSGGDVPDEMPEIEVKAGEIAIADLLAQCFGVSKSEARRMAEQGAVAVDGDKVDDATANVEVREGMTVKMGKRRWARVKVG